MNKNETKLDKLIGNSFSFIYLGGWRSEIQKAQNA